MRYFNESDIENYKSSIIAESADKRIQELLGEKRTRVFLSHSSFDKEILSSVINFLSSYDVDVYVDKTDKELPKITSAKTAEMLKEQIKQCDKFIVLVSENSKISKWIPWEIGIADISKTANKIALLPSTNDPNPKWTKQEYLGLYKHIVNNRFKGENDDVWMVYNPANTKGTELGKWLKQ